MTEILKSNKNVVTVKVNNRIYKIENQNVSEQLSFMENIVPEPVSVFSFAQTTDEIPRLQF